MTNQGTAGNHRAYLVTSRAGRARTDVVNVEPAANLDSKVAAGLLELMVELNREKGVTFLFSSHDPDFLKRTGRLITLKDGAIDGDGAPG